MLAARCCRGAPATRAGALEAGDDLVVVGAKTEFGNANLQPTS